VLRSIIFHVYFRKNQQIPIFILYFKKGLKPNFAAQAWEMARNFNCAPFFGHIFNLNNLTFKKARIMRKEYFNRSRFCFLDFTITSNLKKYF
jgi:hypothetical protein